MLLNRKNARIKKSDAHRNGKWLPRAAAFALRYRSVLDACSLLVHALDALTPQQLARMYMSHVLQTQKTATWWQESADYLTQPWFIYEYACDSGLLQRSEQKTETCPAWLVVEPEEVRHEACVRLHVQRTVGKPSWGSIIMSYEQGDKTFHWLARTHYYRSLHGAYVRTIGEADEPIGDRAVETALMLLKYGYRVCVDEPLLKKKILAEDFTKAYPYWLLEGSEVDKLELRYPRDKRLHSYVYRAGGRWNGTAVEISICNAHLLEDVIRLYGFRLTKGAQRRMDAWRETLSQATVYRPRKRREQEDEQSMVDRFREMMSKKTEVLDDLIDEDE